MWHIWMVFAWSEPSYCLNQCRNIINCERISEKCEWKYNLFHRREYIWKCRFQNGTHFPSASMYNTIISSCHFLIIILKPVCRLCGDSRWLSNKRLIYKGVCMSQLKRSIIFSLLKYCHMRGESLYIDLTHCSPVNAAVILNYLFFNSNRG